MPFDVTCGQCGRAYRVPDDKAGRTFRCRQCDGTVVVLSAGHEPHDSAEADEYGELVLPRPVRRSSSASRLRESEKRGASGPAAGGSSNAGKEQGRRKILGVPLWGCIVGVCSLGFLSFVLCLGVIVWLGREQPPVLADPTVRPLVEQAVEELRAKTAALDAIIHFQDASWSLAQDVGTIAFDTKSGMHAEAPVQIIGTYDTANGSWLWAWDNPSVDKRLTHDATVVRDYGRKHKITALTTRTVECEEADCWEFTAIASKLCDAQGAYRGPAGATRVFVTFGKIQMSKKPAK